MGSYTDISPAEALAKQSEGIALIDVRYDDEWAEVHAEGAQHMPLGTFGLGDLPDGPLMFICAMGARSAQVAEAVSESGRQAFNVAGGTQAWIQAGLPAG